MPQVADAIKIPDHNRLGLDYRQALPRPKVRGTVVDIHCHLFAHRHAREWFESADHFGIHHFSTQTPLEEAIRLQRDFGHRLMFVASPAWVSLAPTQAAVDDWLRRIEAFYNLGSRMAKIHVAPGTMKRTGLRLNDRFIGRILQEIADRKMIIMTHIGDPDTWYADKYNADGEIGDRDLHYRWFQERLEQFRGTPWMCAHMGGNPENLPRLQKLLDRFPDLVLDLSATRWIVREISARRDDAKQFFLKNPSRLLWGSDQVSGDARGFDFLASRFWAHRQLFETDYDGPSNIFDPDLPEERQPKIRGINLPEDLLQKIYRDNSVALMRRVGVELE